MMGGPQRLGVACGILGLTFVALVAGHGEPAIAAPDVDGGAEGDTVFVEAVEQTRRDAADSPGLDTAPIGSSDDQVSAYVEYVWVLACYGPASGDDRSEDACYAARICPNPDELLYRLWGRPRDTDIWVPLGSRCSGDTPPATAPPRLRITPALVLTEIRRIGLPVLRARTQPEDKTLVNFDTIFYTEATPFTATVRLLGRQVDIEAEPTRYTWHYGDGTTTTTTSPGAPYPSKEITYRYADAHTTVTHRVDVTYSARFRVDGGTWQGIDETVDVSGTEGMLRVTEAAPVLSGNYE